MGRTRTLLAFLVGLAWVSMASCTLEGLPDRDTHWTLDGSHLQVECTACHTNPDDVLDVPADCEGCHERPAPPHPGGGYQCDACHSTKGWGVDL